MIVVLCQWVGTFASDLWSTLLPKSAVISAPLLSVSVICAFSWLEPFAQSANTHCLHTCSTSVRHVPQSLNVDFQPRDWQRTYGWQNSQRIVNFLTLPNKSRNQSFVQFHPDMQSLFPFLNGALLPESFGILSVWWPAVLPQFVYETRKHKVSTANLFQKLFLSQLFLGSGVETVLVRPALGPPTAPWTCPPAALKAHCARPA